MFDCFDNLIYLKTCFRFFVIHKNWDCSMKCMAWEKTQYGQTSDKHTCFQKQSKMVVGIKNQNKTTVLLLWLMLMLKQWKCLLKQLIRKQSSRLENWSITLIRLKCCQLVSSQSNKNFFFINTVGNAFQNYQSSFDNQVL